MRINANVIPRAGDNSPPVVSNENKIGTIILNAQYNILTAELWLIDIDKRIKILQEHVRAGRYQQGFDFNLDKINKELAEFIGYKKQADDYISEQNGVIKDYRVCLEIIRQADGPFAQAIENLNDVTDTTNENIARN